MERYLILYTWKTWLAEVDAQVRRVQNGNELDDYSWLQVRQWTRILLHAYQTGRLQSNGVYGATVVTER